MMELGKKSTGLRPRTNPVPSEIRTNGLFRKGSTRFFRSPLGSAAWLVLVLGVCLWAKIPVFSQPHVAGYERFHADEASVEGGAILFSELGCASCHGGSDMIVPRQGPALTNLSSRVDRDWVRSFLKTPESGRKGSTMPSLVHGLSDEEIDGVVAYLGSLGKGLKFRAERHANAERGSALYHEKGCIACHEPTDDFRGPRARGDQFESEFAIAHPELTKKTSLAALHHFLMQPSAFRPDGRMPHFALEKQEAMDIAAHLMDFQPSDPREAVTLKPWPKADASSIELGKAVVQKQNCAACHSLPGIEASTPFPLDATERATGCLSREKEEGVPFYPLSEGQRASLLLFLSREDRSSHDELSFAAMNCVACHERDGRGGPSPETDPYFVGMESLGDSGRIPPPLTGIGHKLLPDAMKHVFTGLEGSRVRSYLKTQMPVYGQHSEVLTKWLQEKDRRVETHSDPLDAEPSADFIGAGQKLLGIHGGVNCITCHQWDQKDSLGIPALDISRLDQRLRYDWFHEYLLNPASYRPGTLMPPLWPGGNSTVPDVLEGNAEKQIGAIWAFIAKGEGIPEGFPDRSGGQFELVPTDQPIIQRTFFNQTGTKAILVGFPGKVHLAYDGAKGKPSLIWRGGFFDAYDTWFTRAAPFGDPLGDDTRLFEGETGERRFLGYRLDREGNPTFLLRVGDQKLEDHFEVSDGILKRVLRWDSGEEPAVGHPKSVEKTIRRKDGLLEVEYRWK